MKIMDMPPSHGYDNHDGMPMSQGNNDGVEGR